MYDQLLGALGMEMPVAERVKPSCCDLEGAAPVDAEAGGAIADAVEHRARGARRQR